MILHDWECLAHGGFEARAHSAREPPRCPHGCSASLVRLVFTRAPGTVSARTRKSDALVREMADLQRLPDVSTSPSRPGGSVADRNRAQGPKGREYPVTAGSRAVKLADYIGAMTATDNALSRCGFGHPYEASEWNTDPESGRVRHLGAQPARQAVPVGSGGVSVERVRGKP